MNEYEIAEAIAWRELAPDSEEALPTIPSAEIVPETVSENLQSQSPEEGSISTEIIPETVSEEQVILDKMLETVSGKRSDELNKSFRNRFAHAMGGS